jgi:hypothetical protein
MSDAREENEVRLASYRKEAASAVKVFVDDTTAQIRDVRATIDTVSSTVRADLDAIQVTLGHDLAGVRSSLSSEIATLSSTLDRVLRSGSVPDPAASRALDPGGSAVGQVGHGLSQQHRGMTSVLNTAPPVGGNTSDRSFVSVPNSGLATTMNTDTNLSGPRVELPQFDGSNPKLWQRRCEEYFHRWSTPVQLWPSYASSLFVADAATWLEAYLHQTPQPTWSGFVAAVLTHFGRNQHQVLVRRLFHISQTSTVADYV